MPAWEAQVAIRSPAQRFEGVTRPWLPYAAPGSEGPCEPFGLAGPESVGAGGSPCARRRVSRAEALYRAGDPFHCLYAVRSGFFKSSATLSDGRDQVVGFHMAGEILGMSGIDTQRHASDAVALEDSEVWVIPSARLEEPPMHREVYRAMSRELVRGQGMMLLLGTTCSAGRVAVFLLTLSERLVARGLAARDFHLRMTRQEIGSYLGMSLETVSRIFSRFDGDRLIRVDRRHVRILDVEGLEAVAARVDP
ncbi:MAG TPA: helix-turn-helix domain-containing protein [Usitatibacter sp.]|nr:helix-turn-helix domain-containing protein [Usitatibacter sp.]